MVAFKIYETNDSDFLLTHATRMYHYAPWRSPFKSWNMLNLRIVLNKAVLC